MIQYWTTWASSKVDEAQRRRAARERQTCSWHGIIRDDCTRWTVWCPIHNRILIGVTPVGLGNHKSPAADFITHDWEIQQGFSVVYIISLYSFFFFFFFLFSPFIFNSSRVFSLFFLSRDEIRVVHGAQLLLQRPSLVYVSKKWEKKGRRRRSIISFPLLYRVWFAPSCTQHITLESRRV